MHVASPASTASPASRGASSDARGGTRSGPDANTDAGLAASSPLRARTRPSIQDHESPSDAHLRGCWCRPRSRHAPLAGRGRRARRIGPGRAGSGRKRGDARPGRGGGGPWTSRRVGRAEGVPRSLAREGGFSRRGGNGAHQPPPTAVRGPAVRSKPRRFARVASRRCDGVHDCESGASGSGERFSVSFLPPCVAAPPTGSTAVPHRADARAPRDAPARGVPQPRPAGRPAHAAPAGEGD